jgi:hypothetical protein
VTTEPLPGLGQSFQHFSGKRVIKIYVTSTALWRRTAAIASMVLTRPPSSDIPQAPKHSLET